MLWRFLDLYIAVGDRTHTLSSVGCTHLVGIHGYGWEEQLTKE